MCAWTVKLPSRYCLNIWLRIQWRWRDSSVRPKQLPPCPIQTFLPFTTWAFKKEFAIAVMELLEGENLRERLGRSVLSWQETVEIGAVADGLAAAHAKDIIHRDLKPENIFVTNDRGVKILDFGLARKKMRLPGKGSNLRAGVSTALGTVGYVSPERVVGEKADARSDIFSLGCVLYEMAAGQRAFERQTSTETLGAILKEQPSEPCELNNSPPPELGRVIVRCLKKEPAKRYQSAQEYLRTWIVC